jgi:hypothetical protein
MPIRRYVEKCAFTPEALSAMGQAVEATAEILGIGDDDVKRQTIAKFVPATNRPTETLLNQVALRLSCSFSAALPI